MAFTRHSQGINPFPNDTRIRVTGFYPCISRHGKNGVVLYRTPSFWHVKLDHDNFTLPMFIGEIEEVGKELTIKVDWNSCSWKPNPAMIHGCEYYIRTKGKSL